MAEYFLKYCPDEAAPAGCVFDKDGCLREDPNGLLETTELLSGTLEVGTTDLALVDESFTGFTVGNTYYVELDGETVSVKAIDATAAGVNPFAEDGTEDNSSADKSLAVLTNITDFENIPDDYWMIMVYGDYPMANATGAYEGQEIKVYSKKIEQSFLPDNVLVDTTGVCAAKIVDLNTLVYEFFGDEANSNFCNNDSGTSSVEYTKRFALLLGNLTYNYYKCIFGDSDGVVVCMASLASTGVVVTGDGCFLRGSNVFFRNKKIRFAIDESAGTITLTWETTVKTLA